MINRGRQTESAERMTFSILALDEDTGRIGGAAATGSLCVGGWVLRGDSRVGMSASQGTAPSTLWGEDVIALMAKGLGAVEAVAQVTAADAGRAHRQLAALDRRGRVAAFTGDQSIQAAGSVAGKGVIVAGNLLSDRAVLEAALKGFQDSEAPFAERLLAALDAGHGAGSDSRGLLSAALLVLGDDIPPLSLRVDLAKKPLKRLRKLYRRSQSSPYADWLKVVPTRAEPQRSG